MSQKFEFPQELILGAIKGNYSFENGIKVNGEDYAVMINKNTKNLMVVKSNKLPIIDKINIIKMPLNNRIILTFFRKLFKQ